MIKSNLIVFADYFQFYIQDETSKEIDKTSWTKMAIQARVAVEPGAFAVATARNRNVPVTISVSEFAPDLDLPLWDHAVEFSIAVSSGLLVIAGCKDYLPAAKQLPLEAGTYEVRVLHANLDTVSNDGLDGDDMYQVELWRGEEKPLVVLKQY